MSVAQRVSDPHTGEFPLTDSEALDLIADIFRAAPGEDPDDYRWAPGSVPDWIQGLVTRTGRAVR